MFLHEINDNQHMFLSNTMYKDNRQPHISIPENRVTYDRERGQTACFPPSYAGIQRQSLHTKRSKSFVVDQGVAEQFIAAACSLSTL